jgi:hypothetical protein
MLNSDEPPSIGPSGDDASYLLSFANEQSFLFRQGIALVLLAAAGIIEFRSNSDAMGIGGAIAATLTVIAMLIMATALRRFRTAEQSIRDAHWGCSATD